MEPFELSARDRHNLGLQPVIPDWDRVDVDGVTVYFEGDVLRKYCKADARGYLEVDTQLPTRERRFVLPRTGRGKEKKLTASLLLVAERANGHWFQVTFGDDDRPPHVALLNTRNARGVPLFGFEQVRSLEALRGWLDEHDRRLTPAYRGELEAAASAPRQRLRYRPGDFFRVRVGYAHYAFGRVVAEVLALRKWGVLADEHVMSRLMTKPLVVRLYGEEHTTDEPALDALAATLMLEAEYVMDNQLFFGELPIVGHRPLEAHEVDFPLSHAIVRGTRDVQVSFGLCPLLRGPGREGLRDFGTGVGLLSAERSRQRIVECRAAPPYGAARGACRQEVLRAVGYEGPDQYAAFAEWAGGIAPEEYLRRLGAKRERAPRG
ncbi:MAG: immunity 26/phosphotriesterase HocA family protein [Sandaracinaceae bacterium]|nr:immunity 26/phosphotriesterase HocA family protein [Myxococcales bacterium]MCB9656563.1 immunity 26/phosphotriesterase HocA family protein [Sandaracinaceae bacterium]